jgi:threonine aldolase
MIDLRSDTVTKPTSAMRRAMADADVGDDVYGEDPTVLQLEHAIAEQSGKEAALFVPSGTMANQLALAGHTLPGDEVLVGWMAHVARYESGAASALSGVQLTTIGDSGQIGEGDIRNWRRPPAYYEPRQSLVCLENTHNASGGRIFPLHRLVETAKEARQCGLLIHLDGARLWNAMVATRTHLADWSRHVDSLSLCFSKGLGAPIGSVLVGNKDFITAARIRRKRWGGGMRQVGILAAAAHYAWEHHFPDLARDHDNATRLAEALSSGFMVNKPETNMVLITTPNASSLVTRARERGVQVSSIAKGTIRCVLHRDIPNEAVPTIATILLDIAKQAAAEDAATKDTAPKDTATKDTAPKDTAPKDTAPKDTAAQEQKNEHA